MIFTTILSSDAIDETARRIGQWLQGDKKVVWFTSGGSCIPLQVSIVNQLNEMASSRLHNLTILPVDERYGQLGHEDSNVEQMRRAGFNPCTAKWDDVLASNLTLDATIDHYKDLVEDALADCDVSIATLGIGQDGHTAGLLPGSLALFDANATIIGYSWSDYNRLTLGVEALLRIDHIVVFAYGETKKGAMGRLFRNVEPIEELPAKLLYDVADVTVYNDYITLSER